VTLLGILIFSRESEIDVAALWKKSALLDRSKTSRKGDCELHEIITAVIMTSANDYIPFCGSEVERESVTPALPERTCQANDMMGE
jgi:hypothetical protein